MRVIFHEFTIGDVDDVDIYVAEPIYEWQQTDKGRWIMEHAHDIKYYTSSDPSTFGYRVSIRGDLEEKQLTEYYLRW